MCQLMKKYPEIFTGDDFFTLLKLLSTLHVESNDYNVVHNIYVCFSLMKDKEEIINTNEPENKTTELWKVVGENTIRYAFQRLIFLNVNLNYLFQGYCIKSASTSC